MNKEDLKKHFKGSQTFRITAIVKGNPDFTTELKADNEWLARTRIMAIYPYPLDGAYVEYRITIPFCRACGHAEEDHDLDYGQFCLGNDGECDCERFKVTMPEDV